MRKIIFLFIFASILVSCRKDDAIMDDVLKGQINLNQEYGLRISESSLGSDYSMQAYYDLGTGENVSSNLVIEWDIAIAKDDQHIILNSAKTNLRAAKIGGEWTDEVIPEEHELDWDSPDGEIQGRAIGLAMDEIFLIDRGSTGSGADTEQFGYKIGMLTTSDNGDFELLVADPDGENEQNFVITFSEDHSYTFINLDSGIIEIAPPAADWDLLFTSYLHIFDAETFPFPYQVTGCMLNWEGVRAIELENTEFESVDLSVINTDTFSQELDIIGYDWKIYDFDLGFIIRENRVYVIEDYEGDYYKLAFTSFYNAEGVKGNPQFEFQKLQP